MIKHKTFYIQPQYLDRFLDILELNASGFYSYKELKIFESSVVKNQYRFDRENVSYLNVLVRLYGQDEKEIDGKADGIIAALEKVS